jgi:glucosamine-6-phosphate deaminase
MRVLLAPDYRTLSRTASELILKAVRTKPELTLGLPTGNTPLGMYEELVRSYREQHMDFSEITTFNLDEYVGLERNDPHSYRFYMQEHFFDHVNVPPGNVHIPEEAFSYEKKIREAGGIDLLVVGVGPNGHIAFNEPGSSFASRTREVTLAPETIANAETHFEGAPIPRRALTMGIGTMLESRCIVFLASGASKVDIVRRALNGPVSESVPASALQMHPNVIAILDEDANPDKK